MIQLTITAENTQELQSDLQSLAAIVSQYSAFKPVDVKTVLHDECEAVVKASDAPIEKPVTPVEEEPAKPAEPAPVAPEKDYEALKEKARERMNALRVKKGILAVRAILEKHGAKSFPEINPTDYEAVIEEATNAAT